MVDDKRAHTVDKIAIRKDILIDRSLARRACIEVVEQKILHACKKPSVSKKRKNFALVALNKPLIWALIESRRIKIHAVFFGKTLDLPMPNHRQTRHGRHQRKNPKIFIVPAKLSQRCLLVR